MSGGLRIVHALSPAPFGGLERVVLDLSAAQRRAGHDVLLFAAAAADHPFVAAARSRGLPLEIVSGSSRGYLREARILRALLRRESPDVVHTHGYRSDVAHGLPVRGLAAVTTTLHGFTSGEWSGWRARVYERIQVVAARWCDAAIAVSDGVAERLRDAGVAPDRIHIVRNAWTGGTAFLDRMEARARLGAPARAPLIGWIGRVSPEKGPDLLLDAMRPLGPTARGVVIGDGPLRAPLEAASRAALGDRVTWCGAVPDAGALVGAFDVVVLSSRTEGTPMVLLEAMAAGVPVAAFAVGGIPAVVSDREAFLAPPGDAAALARAIAAALGDRADASRRAEAARARLAREFSAEAWVRRHEVVYRAAMENFGRRTR